MDVIITVVGEFIWTLPCVIVNFCLNSGLSASVVFVSFLCGSLASGFYKYTTHRERTLTDQSIAAIQPTYSNVTNDMSLLSEVENTEEAIRTEQIRDIYHRLNDDDLSRTDFLEQLKMYGVQIDEKIELDLS